MAPGAMHYTKCGGKNGCQGFTPVGKPRCVHCDKWLPDMPLPISEQRRGGPKDSRWRGGPPAVSDDQPPWTRSFLRRTTRRQRKTQQNQEKPPPSAKDSFVLALKGAQQLFEGDGAEGDDWIKELAPQFTALSEAVTRKQAEEKKAAFQAKTPEARLRQISHQISSKNTALIKTNEAITQWEADIDAIKQKLAADQEKRTKLQGELKELQAEQASISLRATVVGGTECEEGSLPARFVNALASEVAAKNNAELTKSFENLKVCLAEICKAIAPAKPAVPAKEPGNVEKADPPPETAKLPDDDVDMEEPKAGVKRNFDTLFAEGGDLAHIPPEQRPAILRAAEESVTQAVSKARR